MVLSKIATATKDSSKIPQRHGSGWNPPSKSPTLGTPAPDPDPAGIIATGGFKFVPKDFFAFVPSGSSTSSDLEMSYALSYPSSTTGPPATAGDSPRIVARDSKHASARSSMNVLSVSSAGALPHRSIPLACASSRYSISISSKVSMCSLTKLTGTATMALVPFLPKSRITSSVYGLSHSTGPTRDWYARTCSLCTPIVFSLFIINSTHRSISSLYGSPADSTYDTGTPCAEKKITGLSSSKNPRAGFSSSPLMSCAMDWT
mmetsp:Transcript_11072/g.41004  ORF Transcript_11072/g.41004 Transcript_11072/m.41004 type:complete len:261 (+) Transcript_11072:1342-2124(+)